MAWVGKPRILILGGGFGVASTVEHLQRRARGSFDIQLINRDDFLVQKLTIALPERRSRTLAVGKREST